MTGKSENSSILTSMEITNQSKRDFKSLSNNIVYTIIIKGHYKFRKLQRSKYCRNHISWIFILDGLPFSTNIIKDTNVTCITCNGIIDAPYAFTNGNKHETLGVINLEQILNPEVVKRKPNSTNVTLKDSNEPANDLHLLLTLRQKKQIIQIL